MLEARVHEQLRAFLRQQGDAGWPHHLTMARLVARALRLERSALMQVGSAALYQGHYRLSYLMSLLLWPEPAILVVPPAIQQRIQGGDIPTLQSWSASQKPVHYGSRWPREAFRGLLVTTPEAWLGDRLTEGNAFPPGIPTVIDSADDLEAWVRQPLTLALGAGEWEALMQAYPDRQEIIRNVRVQLTHAIFQHPPNPYQCHLIDADEKGYLRSLQQQLDQRPEAMPPPWRTFWDTCDRPDWQLWVTLNRTMGQWTLHSGPIDVAPAMESRWLQQPLVIIGGALDTDPSASLYRQRLGLAEMTCLKFGPDRQTESIQLYLPDTLPLPNTPQFQPALLQKLGQLMVHPAAQAGATVVLVGDVPLKAQVGTALAAQFGSRVQVESVELPANGILVSGWDFWRSHQVHLPAPQLLVIATLPIPSLEDPLVAGRVAYYKRRQQDWFRLYLLPTALGELQRAIAPLRDRQGTVALLDNRVNYRSYGRQILDILSPADSTRRIDLDWLQPTQKVSTPLNDPSLERDIINGE